MCRVYCIAESASRVAGGYARRFRVRFVAMANNVHVWKEAVNKVLPRIATACGKDMNMSGLAWQFKTLSTTTSYISPPSYHL